MNNPATLLSQLDIDGKLRAAFRWAANEQRLSNIKSVLLLLLVLWGMSSLASSVVALIPNPSVEVPKPVAINPAPAGATETRGAEVIDVAPILGMNIFGPVEAKEVEAIAARDAELNLREGIENGAQETRLSLKLTGIVASTSDGLGTAMIEAKKQQELYSVGDNLPANGKVTLAKILPKQVVIDNNGTFELITLFDDNGMVGITEMASAKEETPRSSSSDTTAPEVVDTAEQQRLAAQYRQRLYSDPQSLTGLLSISAVQGEDGLKGYRLSPGRDAAQFTALGLKAGDIVTAVNGYPLSDPTNTVRLYQLMRNATDASLDIERNGSPISVSVSLSNIQ